MNISQANLSNLEDIKQISQKYEFETSRDWKDLISSPSKKLFILRDNNQLIGFSGLIESNWNHTLQISNVFILPDYREQGMASKLIQHLIGESKKTTYRCLIAEAPSNNPVTKLYKKMGFRKCGYNDRYYSNTGDEICIWMSLDLK